MEQDEIIQQVRAAREAYAERFGFDIEALFSDVRRREGQDGRTVVSLEPKRVEVATAVSGGSGKRK
jgi:hypothetical protein